MEALYFPSTFFGKAGQDSTLTLVKVVTVGRRIPRYSHNHGSMENGRLFEVSTIGKRPFFHFHDSGREDTLPESKSSPI